jgi:hypothetical protein
MSHPLVLAQEITSLFPIARLPPMLTRVRRSLDSNSRSRRQSEANAMAETSAERRHPYDIRLLPLTPRRLRDRIVGWQPRI